LRNGVWSQVQPRPAWDGNRASDCFIAYAWEGANSERYLVVVNYSRSQAQCRLPLPFLELRAKQVRLSDVMGTEVYERDGSEMVDPGLYIDHMPWHYNVFELRVT